MTPPTLLTRVTRAFDQLQAAGIPVTRESLRRVTNATQTDVNAVLRELGRAGVVEEVGDARELKLVTGGRV